MCYKFCFYTPTLHQEASKDNDDDASASKDNDDGDASSFGTNEMSTRHFYPMSLMTKRRSSLDMKVVILRGKVSIGSFC